MNKIQIKAIRVIGGIVRDMLNADGDCKAVAVVDSQGMRIDWVEDGEMRSRGWFFNAGGCSANLKNLADMRRWCVGR